MYVMNEQERAALDCLIAQIETKMLLLESIQWIPIAERIF